MRNRSVTYLPEVTFHALGDATRLAVLDLLRAGPKAAGQIAEAFPISRPAISRHLRQLRKARLVTESRRGRHRFYQLNPAPLEAVGSWLERYRMFWQSNLNSLKIFVENERARELGEFSTEAKRNAPSKHK